MMKSLHRCVLSSFLVCYWLGLKTSHSPLKVGIAIAEQQTQVATANPGGDRCWVERPEAWLSPPRVNSLWTVPKQSSSLLPPEIDSRPYEASPEMQGS